MKNLKLILGICLVAVAVIFTSCGKEEVTLEDANQLEASVENEIMDWETLMNTPSTLVDARDLEIEVVESTAERMCCSIDPPYHLSSGTNRFRTDISQESGYYIRYIVYHKDYSNPPNINSTIVGDFEYALNNFYDCTHTNIVDLDGWCFTQINTGDHYTVYAHVYDKSNSNGCCVSSSSNFIGD